MNRKETAILLDRIDDARNFLKSEEFQAIQHQVDDIHKFLERFGTLEEIIIHVKELEKRVYIIKEYLTIDEVAKYLQVSKNTVYRLTSAKEITFFKPNGKTIFINRTDLEKWIGKTPYLSNSDLERQADLLAYQMEKDRVRDRDGKFKKGGKQ